MIRKRKAAIKLKKNGLLPKKKKRLLELFKKKNNFI
jgi:hypothetical protein